MAVHAQNGFNSDGKGHACADDSPSELPGRLRRSTAAPSQPEDPPSSGPTPAAVLLDVSSTVEVTCRMQTHAFQIIHK